MSVFYAAVAAVAATSAAAAVAAATRVVYINTGGADKVDEWVLGSSRTIANLELPVCRSRNRRVPLAHSRHICCR